MLSSTWRTIVPFFLIQGVWSCIQVDRLSLNFKSVQYGFVLISHFQWYSWLDFVHGLGSRIWLLCFIWWGIPQGTSEFQADISQAPCSKQCPDCFADSDSSWAVSLSPCSRTGNLFLDSCSPISWRSTLPQKMIALSRAEAEYYPAPRAAVQVIYPRRFSYTFCGAYGICPDILHSCLCGQQCLQWVDQKHHQSLRSRTCRAHWHPAVLPIISLITSLVTWHPEAHFQNGHHCPVRVSTSKRLQPS